MEASQQEAECTICMMDVEDPHENECMHKYCKPCAENLIKSQGGDQFNCCICVPPGSNGVYNRNYQGLKFAYKG